MSAAFVPSPIARVSCKPGRRGIACAYWSTWIGLETLAGKAMAFAAKPPALKLGALLPSVRFVASLNQVGLRSVRFSRQSTTFHPSPSLVKCHSALVKGSYAVDVERNYEPFAVDGSARRARVALHE